MEIDRHKHQGDLEEAKKRITFCLDSLEKYGFAKGICWETNITRRLTLEELVGALVAAEQQLLDEGRGEE